MKKIIFTFIGIFLTINLNANQKKIDEQYDYYVSIFENFSCETTDPKTIAKSHTASEWKELVEYNPVNILDELEEKFQCKNMMPKGLDYVNSIGTYMMDIQTYYN